MVTAHESGHDADLLAEKLAEKLAAAQRLMDPRQQVNFGLPDLAAAVPPPTPAQQLEAQKEQLLAAMKAEGKEMSEEAWQVQHDPGLCL